MNISYFFGLLAGLGALTCYSMYFIQTVKGKSTPNPSSWLIWLIIGVINSITFFRVTHSLWQSFITIAVVFCVTVVFLYSLFKGKFSKVTKVEVIMFVLSIAIGIFWQLTSNDRISNLLLQSVYVISYIPTLTGIVRGTAKEHPTAWVAAFVAYLFSTISIALDPSSDWIAFVHPIVNGLIGNGAVAVLAWYKRKE